MLLWRSQRCCTAGNRASICSGAVASCTCTSTCTCTCTRTHCFIGTGIGTCTTTCGGTGTGICISRLGDAAAITRVSVVAGVHCCGSCCIVREWERIQVQRVLGVVFVGE